MGVARAGQGECEFVLNADEISAKVGHALLRACPATQACFSSSDPLFLFSCFCFQIPSSKLSILSWIMTSFACVMGAQVMRQLSRAMQPSMTDIKIETSKMCKSNCMCAHLDVLFVFFSPSPRFCLLLSVFVSPANLPFSLMSPARLPPFPARFVPLPSAGAVDLRSVSCASPSHCTAHFTHLSVRLHFASRCTDSSIARLE